jgi:hypothetical protein
MQEERYSFQVRLENVEFAFDEGAASALELDPEMSAVERAECYLRTGVQRPVQLAESDVRGIRSWSGTRHPWPTAASWGV